jgi:DNA-binding CsgD family transcriptional regulator
MSSMASAIIGHNLGPGEARLMSRSAAPIGILEIVDSLRCGGFLLDRHARVLSFNATALGCLGEGLILARERLSATDRATDRRLQSLIGSRSGYAGEASVAMSVAIPRQSRLPLVLRTLRLGGPGSPALNAPSLLLLALDPEMCPGPSSDILTLAFRLTRAEAAVAIGIAGGKTLAQIAADRGLKIGTVRAYSKAAFSKTGTRGQAGLTGVLTRLAFLVPHTEEKPPRSIMDGIRSPRPLGALKNEA